MNTYNTNIIKLTCSCLDWEETRKEYQNNDPRRLCKHIINKLDINNLPSQIYKFKDSIEFYQEKEWGFKRDFDEIIELNNFTLLGNIDWIDVFDEDGNRYAVKKEYSSIYWSGNIKPNEYQIIEKYLIGESKKIPRKLPRELYPQVAKLIKEVLPHKKDFYITFDESQCMPTPDGVYYSIVESKLTPKQSKILEKELLDEYGENEAYYKLGEACMTPIGREHEFDLDAGLTVTDNEYIVTMYSGKKYIFDRASKQLKKVTEHIW